nr:MAG TPA: hypothetical protein [Caudoviricetes sp.]
MSCFFSIVVSLLKEKNKPCTYYMNCVRKRLSV